MCPARAYGFTNAYFLRSCQSLCCRKIDEIDTGISGEAAKQVGIILKQIAHQRQVISITHQPQIAGKADAHFYVYKQTKNDAVHTGIALLSKDERIQAIARMLAGDTPTAAAVENAREMIAN